MFERTIAAVTGFFERQGLGWLTSGISRIRQVRGESYHDARYSSIGLNPADAKKAIAAFQRRPFLLIHELGHHFAEVVLSREDRLLLAPLFGDYDAPYRRGRKPLRAGPDHVSRYAMVHPAEDFAETFAVCVWRQWEARDVKHLMGCKSRRCRRKIAAVERLLQRERSRRTAAAAGRRARNRRQVDPLPPGSAAY